MKPQDLVLTPRGLRYQGKTYPCSIGRNGTTDDKTEGDGATPRGMMRIIACFHRPDRIRTPNIWSRPITLNDLWCDDPSAPHYNNLTHAPDPYSHEKMRRADPLYDLVLATNWNWPNAVAGKGSAIFLHSWRKPGHPTEGCVALRPEHLWTIASTCCVGTRLIVK